ncbi:MAG: hypothetical protein BWY82_01249 [Verrucomicrobia bacterium ADurb.Bin474]|nr:MAG: hypothetical protein BWY82_01249 [Verrucomicrobia bacterium ADurb.Bin474]
MELNPNHEWMVCDFDDLNQTALGVCSGDAQSFAFEGAAIFIIEFVSMAVALADLRFTVGIPGNAPIHQIAAVGSEAHGGPFSGDVLLGFHQVDHRIGCLFVKLLAVCFCEPEHMPREFNGEDVKTEA